MRIEFICLKVMSAKWENADWNCLPQKRTYVNTVKEIFAFSKKAENFLTLEKPSASKERMCLI